MRCRFQGLQILSRRRSDSGRRGRWSKGSDGSRARPTSGDLAKLARSAKGFGDDSSRASFRPVREGMPCRNGFGKPLKVSRSFLVHGRETARRPGAGDGRQRHGLVEKRERGHATNPRARTCAAGWDVLEMLRTAPWSSGCDGREPARASRDVAPPRRFRPRGPLRISPLRVGNGLSPPALTASRDRSWTGALRRTGPLADAAGLGRPAGARLTPAERSSATVREAARSSVRTGRTSSDPRRAGSSET